MLDIMLCYRVQELVELNRTNLCTKYTCLRYGGLRLSLCLSSAACDVEAPPAVNTSSMAATETTGETDWSANNGVTLNNHVSEQHKIANGNAHKPVYKFLDLEIDKLEDIVKGACTKPIALYSYFEVPEYLRVNPYIHHGYRALLPFGSCLQRYVYYSKHNTYLFLYHV